MALRKCRECGREISTDAKACPHCGRRSPTGTSGSTWGCLAIILVIVIIIAKMPSTPTTPDAPTERSDAAMPAAARKKAIAAQVIATCKAPHTAKSEKYLAKYPQWDNETIADIACGRFRTGMDSVQLRASLGRPDIINAMSVPGAGGGMRTRDQWVYGDTYIYLDDGVLTSWQNSHH
jgi:RNA polymerase subunit RPABC4/transcription elongation factor Spt4